MRTIHRIYAQAQDTILGLVFPLSCISCGEEDTWLCSDCFKNIPLHVLQQCIFCNKHSPYGKTCGACMRYHELDGVLSCVPYHVPIIRDIIHQFKYNNAALLSKILADIIAHGIKTIEKKQKKSFAAYYNRKRVDQYINNPFPPLYAQTIDCVPVPLHVKKQKQRGFNQALLLARDIVRTIPEARKWNLRDCIVRTRTTLPQAQLDTVDRIHNVRHAFMLRTHREQRSADTALIIDDVVTSGSSCDEIASLLKKTGYRCVWALSPAYGHHYA